MFLGHVKISQEVPLGRVTRGFSGLVQAPLQVKSSKYMYTNGSCAKIWGVCAPAMLLHGTFHRPGMKESKYGRRDKRPWHQDFHKAHWLYE